MIFRYRYGAPIETGAVVTQLPVAGGDPNGLTTERAENGAVTWHFPLGAEDQLFGLGESVRGINKRGHLYRSWNSDDFSHTENKASLYQSHNFLLVSGEKRTFGLFLDDPGEVTWDLAYTSAGEAVITSVNGDLDVYLIEPENEAHPLTDICRQLRRLTGRSYVPPRWALGYLQSRWGYASEADIRGVVENHRERGIPLDGVCLDIDYMERFRDFSWNREAFPDLGRLCAELREEHIRLVPIIDAGIRMEAGDPVYDEGLEKGYFCKKADGTPFVAAVWPGPSCFPDFLRPEVRTWFGGLYRELLENGIEGFWNDMNEPALFYTPEGLEEAYDTIESLRGETMEHDASFRLSAAFGSLANNRADYRRFMQQAGERTLCHEQVHNLYGTGMVAATAEGFRSYNPDRRFLLFARAGSIGSHRDGGMWMGDNSSWWSHLLMNLKMLPSLSMCGYLFCGADLGGFSCNTTEDLLLRWLQLGVFTPLMRNHSALHTRDQEIYRFESWPWMRDTLTVRYALLPWLYSELMQAALTDGLLYRPLAFDYPGDQLAARVEDQVLLASSAMITPVYEQNARGRHVYLPEDMLLIRFRSAADYDLMPLKKGHHWLELGLREFPLLVRRGELLPLAQPADCSEKVETNRLTLLGWLCDGAVLRFYEDDGFTTRPSLEAGTEVITVRREGGVVRVSGTNREVDVSRLIWDE